MTLLRCEGIGKTWPAAPNGEFTQALIDVSLSVNEGDFVAIVGPSGCGKSTLLEIIAGLESASAGRVLMYGEPVTGPGPERCMVFQDHSLFPWLSVADNVGYGLRRGGTGRAETARRVEEVLGRVGLTRFARYFPHQLSGGMKQRTAIARALVNNPEVVLMDEPFAALDYQTRVLMQRFLLELWQGFGNTVLFVTHHIDEAILLADRVYCMSAGPGRLLDELTIELPRPRDYTLSAFNDYRIRLTQTLEAEVMRGYQQQLQQVG